MKGNHSGQLCSSCNSHVVIIREKGKVIFECSYCGLRPEDIDSVSLEDLQYE
ncbi:hypothetical protein [Bacillus wiedmannii]|uniref:hypothetical protein n=1 Tax=Bacillus wiedmannii TaxID=1890302 RepID=UPI0015D51FAC|nr:hypothetical protein [Bacillus wiedmannii]